jgi:hypothetical protein
MKSFGITNGMKRKTLFLRQASNNCLVETTPKCNNLDALRSFGRASLSKKVKIFTNLLLK